jgi:hypothetical protein
MVTEMILKGSCAHLAVLELSLDVGGSGHDGGDESEGKGDGELHLEGRVGGFCFVGRDDACGLCLLLMS